MDTGLRLRQIRERLGLTYRDVERASQELASRRGRPEFILHISRLAEIENHGLIPGIHKIYTLAAVYHVDPLHILAWYEVPLEELFADGAISRAPNTHMAAPGDRQHVLGRPADLDADAHPIRSCVRSAAHGVSFPYGAAVGPLRWRAGPWSL